MRLDVIALAILLLALHDAALAPRFCGYQRPDSAERQIAAKWRDEPVARGCWLA